MCPRNRLAHRQAQATSAGRPVARLFNPIQRFEQSGQMFVRYRWRAILYLDANIMVIGRQRDPRVARSIGVAETVCHQIIQHLFDPWLIAYHRHGCKSVMFEGKINLRIFRRQFKARLEAVDNDDRIAGDKLARRAGKVCHGERMQVIHNPPQTLRLIRQRADRAHIERPDTILESI